MLVAHNPPAAGYKRDASGKKRFMDFRGSLSKYTTPKTLEFGLPGQRVTIELAVAMSSSSTEWMSHHLDFVHKSGLSPSSGVCRSHRRITEAIQAMQRIDPKNLPAIVGVEILRRYLVQIETAVARNLTVPDFKNVDALIGSTVHRIGGLVLTEYDKFIAQAQYTEVFTLKQHPLWRNEQWVDVGGQGSVVDGDQGGGGGRTAVTKDDGKGKGGHGRAGRGSRGAPAEGAPAQG
jgi:hypothetical protein